MKEIDPKLLEETLSIFDGPPRDRGRIPHVIHALKALWSTEPDTRLGQLIVNITHRHNLSLLEDDDFLHLLEEYVKTHH